MAVSALLSCVLWIASFTTHPQPEPPTLDDGAQKQRTPQADSPSRQRPPTGPRSGLFLAKSSDGLKFESTGAVLVQDGRAPTAVRLSDGSVLVVYERFQSGPKGATRQLVAIRSSDKGESWSKPKKVALSIESNRLESPREPALVATPDGKLVLLFANQERRGRRKLYAARSEDGSTFDVSGPIQLSKKQAPVSGLTAFYAGKKRCLVLGTVTGRAGDRFLGEWNGVRRIKRLGRPSPADVGWPGCVVKTDDGFRLYATHMGGVMSAVSTDGETWRREGDLRLAGAAHPAVVRLEAGSYLMIHSKLPVGSWRRNRDGVARDGNAGDIEVVDVDAELFEITSAEQARFIERFLRGESGDAIDVAGQSETSEEPNGDVGDPTELAEQADAEEGDSDAAVRERSENTDEEMGEQDRDDSSDADETSKADGSEPALRIVFDEDDVVDGAVSVESLDESDPLPFEGDVPVPDFSRHVDYRSWIENRHDADGLPVNAYDYYDAFMPRPNDDPSVKPEWPTLRNMFTDGNRGEAPGPWDPVEHPEWEEGRVAASDLIARFTEAAGIEGYVRRIEFAQGEQVFEGGDVDGIDNAEAKNLLINIMLPNLSGHRKMVKQTMSDAWRAPDGRVDPDAMMEAFETVLGSANHVEQGDFLIEMLVGIAEKSMVHESARLALKQGLFDEQRIEQTLNLLADKDRPLRDPQDWADGELASQLDMTQYVYGPIQPGRRPTLNPERLRLISGLAQSSEGPTPEQIAASDPQKTVDLFVNHARDYADMARRGYPEVKAADLDRMAQSYVNQDPVAHYMLPALSRVYQLANRYEASRRATQLTYAIHLHKKQTGQWPASLDDLPPRYTEGVRIDPFSGRDFAYRVTADGPVLYSTSENGVDDGGNHHRRWGDRRADIEVEGDDFVFWPPQPR